MTNFMEADDYINFAEYKIKIEDALLKAFTAAEDMPNKSNTNSNKSTNMFWMVELPTFECFTEFMNDDSYDLFIALADSLSVQNITVGGRSGDSRFIYDLYPYEKKADALKNAIQMWVEAYNSFKD